MFRRGKYKNTRIEYDGYKFDSKAEMEFYQYLKYCFPTTEIKVHPRYGLQDRFISTDGEKIRPIEYEADFEIQRGEFKTVYDVKGMATPEALLKRKLFLFTHPSYELRWVVKYKNQRVDYFENIKRRRENKK